MLSNLISAAGQVLVFSAIPFVVWLITARNKQSFWAYVGLVMKPNANHKTMAVDIAIFFVLMIAMTVLNPILFPELSTIQNQYAGLGWQAVPSIMIFGFVQTGLSEEILFRGFIAKRCIAQWGFTGGNLIQGLIFGLLHGAGFYTQTGFLGSVYVTAVTGFSGWLLGHLMEIGANGSIIPGWILAHGLGNVLVSLYYCFFG